MIAPSNNYDLICYQLRNNLYSHLENPLKKELDRLSKDIKTIITSGNKVQVQSMAILEQLFNLRIKAIRWLASDSNFDYLQMVSEILPQIEEIKLNRKLEVLSENLLFALRCNQRVVESLLGTNEISSDHGDSILSELPEINYQQYIATLALTIPDDEICQKFMDWTSSSLHIEFVMIAADIINDENLKISDKTINELAFLVSDSAQEYSALATELGILKSHSKKQSFSQMSFDNAFVKEQKNMANLGLTDFAKNFSN